MPRKLTASPSAHLLPDMLAPRLKLVFCGTAASTTSAREGAYYAKPGNRFWPTLYRAGITPREFRPQEFRALLDLGIGLTDLCKTHFGTDAELPPDAFDVDAFEQKIRQFAPRMVAFTSKNAGRAVLGQQPAYGLQQQTIGPTKLFVLPSPSGLATKFFDVSYWEALARELHRE